MGWVVKVELRATEVFHDSTEARKSPAPCVAWKKPGERAWGDWMRGKSAFQRQQRSDALDGWQVEAKHSSFNRRGMR
jgi:hypothetical protein